MLACRGHLVSRGILFYYFNVRGESASGVDTLEQVMTEQAVVADAVCQRGLERCDVVDSLAAVRALAEHVLIDVRDGEGVRIDAAGPGENTLESRRFVTGGQRRRHPGLQYPV